MRQRSQTFIVAAGVILACIAWVVVMQSAGAGVPAFDEPPGRGLTEPVGAPNPFSEIERRGCCADADRLVDEPLAPSSADSYPPDPAADIPWPGAFSVDDIEWAFNEARKQENADLNLALPPLDLPAQQEWDAWTEGRRALWLINQERADRGLLPLEGLESNAASVAQEYSRYLLDHGAWGHEADGRSPWARLTANAAIGACHDLPGVPPEVLFLAPVQDAETFPAVEMAVYVFLYADAAKDWGHRHALLWSRFENNHGPSTSEGFLGVGRSGGEYAGELHAGRAQVVAMNLFDPCPGFDNNLYMNFGNPSMTLTGTLRRNTGEALALSSYTDGNLFSSIAPLGEISRPFAPRGAMTVRPVDESYRWTPPQCTVVFPHEGARCDFVASSTLDLVGQIGGSASAVALVNGYAYVAVGPYLAVVDTADPLRPTVVRRIQLPMDGATTILAAGQRLYVGGASLVVYDVQAPAAPVQLGVVLSTTGFSSFALSGDYLFAAQRYSPCGDIKGGIRVFAVGESGAPKLVAFTQTAGDPTSLLLLGSRLYLGEGAGITHLPGGLTIFDAANPRQLTKIGSYRETNDVMTVVGSGTLVHVLDYAAGLRTLDVANPAQPIVRAQQSLGSPRSLTRSGNLLLVGLEQSLRLFDVSAPDRLTQVGVVYLGDVQHIAVSEAHAYLIRPKQGLAIYDIARPSQPRALSSLSQALQARKIALAPSAPYAYVTDYHGGTLTALSLKNPGQPERAGVLTLSEPGPIAVSGALGYVASGRGLMALDLSRPETPVRLGACALPSWPQELTVDGRYVYVAAYDAGLRIVDVADHWRPAEVGFFDTPGLAFDVAVHGQLTFVADGSAGLAVLSAEDPHLPRSISVYRPAEGETVVQAVTLQYPRLWLSYYVPGDNVMRGGIVQLDVSDPAAPRELARFAGGGYYGLYGMTVRGEVVYATSYTEGLAVISFSNRASPTIVARYLPGKYTYAAELAGKHIYVAGGEAGLAAVRNNLISFRPGYLPLVLAGGR